MKIYLHQHNHRFAVEQTVMGLLPDEKIETQEIIPDYLLSQEERENTSLFPDHSFLFTQLVKEEINFIGQAFLWRQGKLWKGEFSFPFQEDTTIQKQKEQFSLKEALYLAVVQSLDSPPLWGNLTGVRPVKLVSKLWKEVGDEKKVEEILRNTYHVQEERGKIALECGKISLDLERKLKDTVSIYAGIPFCPSRCSYCSFFSSDVRQHQDKLPEYVNGICWEIQELAPLLPKEKISSIYVGGGTPTVLPEAQLSQLLQGIQEKFLQKGENRISYDGIYQEFTVEAGRPDTLTVEKFNIMEAMGVERISINPQTMNSALLEKLGRNHTAEQIIWAVEQGKGKFILNMDLIAGLEGDTKEGFLHSLQEVIALEPQQITVHSLTQKRTSAMSEEKKRQEKIFFENFKNGTNPTNLGKCEQFNSENLVEALEIGNSLLKNHNYRPYYLYRQKKIAGGLENIGWTLPNFQGSTPPCVYNVTMMEEFQTIIAFGAGAMSKWISSGGGLKRHSNPKFYWEYLDKLPQIVQEKKVLLEEFWKSKDCSSDIV